MITKTILTAFFALLFSFSGFAQTNELTVYITSKSDKLFGKTDLGEKIISFEISGLNDETAMNNFIQKFLKNDLVIDFTVIPATFNGKRKATATFNSNVRIKYFQTLLQNMNVQKIVIDNEEIPISGLLEWVEKKKEEKKK